MFVPLLSFLIGMVGLSFPGLFAGDMHLPAAQQDDYERPFVEVAEITFGEQVERSLPGSEHHLFRIRLLPGQILRAGLAQDGADLAVTVAGPDGRHIGRYDCNGTWFGIEPIDLTARLEGSYLVTIEHSRKCARAGRYRLSVMESNQSAAGDENRAAAEDTASRAKLAASLQTSQSGSDAVDLYRRAADLWRNLGEGDHEALMLHNAGQLLNLKGEGTQALEFFNQAHELWLKSGNHRGQAYALNAMGMMWDSQGEKEKAETQYRKALSIWLEEGDRRGEAESLNNLGFVLDSTGKWKEALDCYQKAFTYFQETATCAEEAIALINIGGVHDNRGEKEKALEFFARALPMTRLAGDRRNEATALESMGGIYDNCGYEKEALDHLSAALAIHHDMNNLKSEADTVARIGMVYDDLGQSERAVEFYQRSLDLSRLAKDQFGECGALNNLGFAYEFLEDKPKAARFYSEALDLGRRTNDLFCLAYATDNLAHICFLQGDKERARELHGRAIEMSRSLNHPRLEAIATGNLATLHSESNDLEGALRLNGRTAEIIRKIGDPKMEAQNQLNTARVLRKLGRLQEALEKIESALQIVERLRRTIPTRGLRTSFSASFQKYYRFYIDVLMTLHDQNQAQGYSARAFEAAERNRARTLAEMLGEHRYDIRRGIEPDLLMQERELQRKINFKARSQTPEGKKDLERLLLEFDEVEARIKVSNPNYSALTQPQPLPLSVIQQQVLDKDTLLLEYSMGDERSYLWAISSSELRSYSLPGRSALESSAMKLREVIQKPSLVPQKQDTASLRTEVEALGRSLLGPALAMLPGKRLLIVADGALQLLPFSVLQSPQAKTVPAGTHPLILDHEIVFLPSVSIMPVLRRNVAEHSKRTTRLVVLADPVYEGEDPRVQKGVQAGVAMNPREAKSVKPAISASNRSTQASVLLPDESRADGTFHRLPYSRQEGEAISALLPPARIRSAFDFSASRATLTGKDLARYTHLHIASHAVADGRNAELSGVVLSLVDRRGRPDDGFVRLHEIYNLDLPAELVVLSACQTALGKDIPGEGLVGLTRGFMYAGAARVVASLWNVEDLATAELMKEFYAAMFGPARMEPAAALRKAQSAMLASPRWHDAYYWAGFVIQGEWR